MHMDGLFLGVKTNLWGTYGTPDMTHAHVTRRHLYTHTDTHTDRHFLSSKCESHTHTHGHTRAHSRRGQPGLLQELE